MELVRNNEKLSEYFIGDFGDKRLNRIGALFFKRMCNLLTTCIKRLGEHRATEVAFGRFLRNEKVTVEKISSALSSKTNEICKNLDHVLCIQDTVESNYPTQAIKKIKFGPTSHAETKGFFMHPAIIVNAKNKDIIGISDVSAWIRTEPALKTKTAIRPIEEKESIRWVNAINNTKKAIKKPTKITAIGDRENDIYEFFDRVPDNRTDVIVRARHNRELSNGERLFSHMNNVASIGNYDLKLPEITGKRKSRIANIEIKFSKIKVCKPNKVSDNEQDEITLTCIEAKEVGVIPDNEKPIFWRLLTTHEVNNVSDGHQIITWYTWRWVIEQLFRTMKSKGLHIEDSEVETPKELLNMFVIGLATAIKVLSLVYARDGSTERPASDLFEEDEIIFFITILKTLEGKTKKQQNPYKKESLSWASWIIARLGGWNCYGKPAGPITMYRGLKIFEDRYYGWSLAKKDVCIP